MKVGDLISFKPIDFGLGDWSNDLVKWENVLNDSMDHYRTDYGVIIKMSRTGHTTHSAQVLFSDGELAWFDTQSLEVVNESR